MGIDISRLSPQAQAQIARKLAAQSRDKAEKQAAAQEEKKNKYRNTPTDRQGAEGKKIRFDSKREAARYDELMLMLKAGKIRDLKLQPQFTLQEAYTTPEGNRIRAIIYKADFSYEAQDWDAYSPVCWRLVVEDVKSKATKTRVYAMKKKLLREKFGIDIVEVE